MQSERGATRTRAWGFGLAGAVVCLSAVPAFAQEGGRKTLVVITFDQLSVQSGLQEVFGRDGVNVGLSIARLVARRLGDNFTVVEAPGALPWGSDPATIAAVGRQMNADAVLAGTVEFRR